VDVVLSWGDAASAAAMRAHFPPRAAEPAAAGGSYWDLARAMGAELLALRAAADCAELAPFRGPFTPFLRRSVDASRWARLAKRRVEAAAESLGGFLLHLGGAAGGAAEPGERAAGRAARLRAELERDAAGNAAKRAMVARLETVEALWRALNDAHLERCKRLLAGEYEAVLSPAPAAGPFCDRKVPEGGGRAPEWRRFEAPAAQLAVFTGSISGTTLTVRGGAALTAPAPLCAPAAGASAARGFVPGTWVTASLGGGAFSVSAAQEVREMELRVAQLAPKQSLCMGGGRGCGDCLRLPRFHAAQWVVDVFEQFHRRAAAAAGAGGGDAAARLRTATRAWANHKALATWLGVKPPAPGGAHRGLFAGVVDEGFARATAYPAINRVFKKHVFLGADAAAEAGALSRVWVALVDAERDAELLGGGAASAAAADRGALGAFVSMVEDLSAEVAAEGEASLYGELVERPLLEATAGYYARVAVAKRGEGAREYLRHAQRALRLEAEREQPSGPLQPPSIPRLLAAAGGALLGGADAAALLLEEEGGLASWLADDWASKAGDVALLHKLLCEESPFFEKGSAALRERVARFAGVAVRHFAGEAERLLGAHRDAAARPAEAAAAEAAAAGAPPAKRPALEKGKSARNMALVDGLEALIAGPSGALKFVAACGGDAHLRFELEKALRELLGRDLRPHDVASMAAHAIDRVLTSKMGAADDGARVERLFHVAALTQRASFFECLLQRLKDRLLASNSASFESLAEKENAVLGLVTTLGGQTEKAKMAKMVKDVASSKDVSLEFSAGCAAAAAGGGVGAGAPAVEFSARVLENGAWPVVPRVAFALPPAMGAAAAAFAAFFAKRFPSKKVAQWDHTVAGDTAVVASGFARPKTYQLQCSALQAAALLVMDGAGEEGLTAKDLCAQLGLALPTGAFPDFPSELARTFAKSHGEGPAGVLVRATKATDGAEGGARYRINAKFFSPETKLALPLGSIFEEREAELESIDKAKDFFTEAVAVRYLKSRKVMDLNDLLGAMMNEVRIPTRSPRTSICPACARPTPYPPLPPPLTPQADKKGYKVDRRYAKTKIEHLIERSFAERTADGRGLAYVE